MKKQQINKFEKEYFFLSNYYDSPVTYEGITYKNSEAAFHAQKVIGDLSLKKQFAELTPDAAKRLGRKVPLRADWELVKDSYMYEIVKSKFQNANLARRLLETGNAELVEGNYWGDRYWGVCDGEGQNKLGKILMAVRDELKEQRADETCVCCGASLGNAELGTQVCANCSAAK